MAESIIKQVSEMLNEEKWTRATLNNYTITNFKELDTLIQEATASGQREELNKLCEEHLSHTKNSIIALYISGLISLSKHLIDDSKLVMLINIFTDNHKWNLVEYLCQRILDFGENKYALRSLAECYIHKNEEENKYKIWERLIKIDYDEAEIVQQLAQKKEAEGDLTSAVEYYKKALYRFINKKLFANVKEVWSKLLQLCPEELEFFFSVDRKIEKLLNTERALSLIEMLYPYYKQKANWNACLEILKRMLYYNPRETKYRRELIFCYKEKYKDNPQVDEYIKLSNLKESWRNINEAIADFEKHISFAKNNYVYHRSWGIGKIVDIKDDVFIIDFPTRKGHKMTLQMAVNALETLSSDHIWVLKATMPLEELAKKIEAEPTWALKVLIHSHNNAATLKDIRNDLVPDVFSASRWQKWSSEARQLLKTEPTFGVDPENPDKFILREKPISLEEKIFNRFKAEKNFFTRLDIMQEFIENADPDSEYFNEIFSYFTSFLKSFNQVNEYVIDSYLIVQQISKRFPFLNPGLSISFEELFQKLNNVGEVFDRLNHLELKKTFLISVKNNLANWPQIYIDIFPYYLNRLIIDELLAAKKKQELQNLFLKIFDHYKEHREAFIWLVRNCLPEEWVAELNIKYEKILICLIHLLDITFREIDNHREVSLNRKLNKILQQYLFIEKNVETYFNQSDEDSIARIFTLIEDVKHLDPSIKINLKQKIKDRFPSFHFLGEHEIEKVRRGLLVTHRGYEEKQRQLKHLLEVEIPENSKEIGLALKKGDLRENAEYKAALEKQELLKTSVAKLQEELQSAQIFDENNIDTTSIGFGTKVTLHNLHNGAEEVYTIYGPWESDPAQSIISYLSPLGMALCNHKLGEELNFTINEQEYKYKVLKIEKA